jgi:hypothetical protein
MSTIVPFGRTRLRPLVAALAALLVAVACTEDAPTGDDIRGLVILSGDVGEARIAIHADPDGTARSIEPPSPATSWLSVGPDGRLVATQADGQLGLRDLDGSEGWRMFEPDPSSAGSLLFGTVSPDGELAAALTLAAAGQFGIAIVDLDDGQTVTFPVEGTPLLASPAWLDGERVGVAVVDAETGGAVSVADVASGSVTGGPGDVRAFAMSADGGVTAWIASSDGRLRATNARSWLTGATDGAFAIDGPGATRPGSFALDASGGRLVVVWEEDDGTVDGIEVFRRTADGWTAVGRLDPPGGDPRAVVGWLR